VCPKCAQPVPRLTANFAFLRISDIGRRSTTLATSDATIHPGLRRRCDAFGMIPARSARAGSRLLSALWASDAARRRVYKRDKRGRFAPTGSTRVRWIARRGNRRRPRYVRGSLGHALRVGRVGPGGEYAGVHVGAKLRTRRRGEYYVGVSAGRKIATPFSPY
jgi:hypothetical protein